jgi:DNA-binding MarR family transcriptional regulator
MDPRRELAESIVHHYLMMHRHQRRASHQLSKEFGISGREIAVLRFLAAEGSCSVGDISRHLDVRDATSSPLLDEMEQAGWVTRTRCLQDGRRLVISPTDQGRRMAAEAPATMLGRLRDRLPNLSVEELATIDAALKRLIDLADIDESLEG